MRDYIRAGTMFAMRLASALFVIAIAAGACRSSTPAPSYSGTVIIGSDYVQVLATAPGDAACPPRIQTVGRCVRTPPRGESECLKAPPCITRLSVAGTGDAVSAAGSFVRVPWLAARAGRVVKISLSGCGGELAFEVELPSKSAAIEPFESATGRRTGEQIRAAWNAAGRGDNVCALVRSDSATEVCCTDDSGRASFAAPDGASDFRLSRGRQLKGIGKLEVYQTRETKNLLGE